MKNHYLFNHIELFSGCGGLSLGLDKAGFKLLLANELSPMAAETFSYNFFNEDFQQLAKDNQKPKHAYWISSQFERLSQRLRENPFQFPLYSVDNTDLPQDAEQLKGNLIIGDIFQLNKILSSDETLLKTIRNGFNENGVDLVSGGPPCQGFSMAGLREKDSHKNTLPWEFANFVEHIQPKIAVLENVTGILRAFKDKNGDLFHAWFEVAKTFATKKYIPLCLHVNARFVGVPQNRPRFIMIAIRYDIFEKLEKKISVTTAEWKLFEKSKIFYQLVQERSQEATFGTLPYFDVTKANDLVLFETSFLHYLVGHNLVSVSEALDDLKMNEPKRPSSFVKELNKTFSAILQGRDKIYNHEYRRNSHSVQRRFRLYQVLQKCNDKNIKKSVFNILKGHDNTISDSIWDELKLFDYLKDDNKMGRFSSKSEFIHYLQLHPTKKQTQKALDAKQPAPAALSIPDDACHYDKNELRVLTVREMARIQSFPDNFIFRSKITTGGKMRKFEIPQYTQVGNAVPPLLGLALGKCISELLNKLHEN
ncbi:DNA cytosine methyltransferase [Yersinia mollaretii]|uniref:DNA cytosine methyltransferase n=1 Tax=Yersinia mollaretii TaxID=33060 RepID=UPI0021BD1102|nr:DNA cytosine methyltransferase [Yersinia mollaretii]